MLFPARCRGWPGAGSPAGSTPWPWNRGSSHRAVPLVPSGFSCGSCHRRFSSRHTRVPFGAAACCAGRPGGRKVRRGTSFKSCLNSAAAQETCSRCLQSPFAKETVSLPCTTFPSPCSQPSVGRGWAGWGWVLHLALSACVKLGWCFRCLFHPVLCGIATSPWFSREWLSRLYHPSLGRTPETRGIRRPQTLCRVSERRVFRKSRP